MSNDEEVSKHYSHGSLLKAIQEAITKLGKTIDSVAIEDLSPVEVIARKYKNNNES